MSADNTILILRLKDEFRVGHFHAVENIYWSWEGQTHSNPVSVRVFEFFHNSPKTNTQQEALKVAQDLYDDIGYVEYGIQSITIDKTFLEIVNEAKEDIQKEIYILSQKFEFSIAEDLKIVLNKINGYLALYG